MERPDNITGALRYGAKRERRQQQRQQQTSLLGNRPGVFDANFYKDLPGYIATEAAEGVIAGAVGDVTEAANTWINSGAQRERQLWTTHEKAQTKIAELQEAQDYAARLYQLNENSGGDMERTLMNMHEQEWVDRYKRLAARGEITWDGNQIPASALTNDVIKLIIEDDLRASVQPLIEPSNQVLNLRNQGNVADLKAYLDINNPRARNWVEKVFKGNKKTVDEEKWQQMEKSQFFQGLRVFEQAVDLAKQNNDLSYIDNALQQIKIQDKISPNRFDVRKVDTEMRPDPETGGMQKVLITYVDNPVTRKTDVTETVLETTPISIRTRLKQNPIMSVLKQSGLNPRAQSSLVQKWRRLYTDKNGDPLALNRLHEYWDTPDILGMRNNMFNDIEALLASAVDNPLVMGDTRDEQNRKQMQAQVSSLIKNLKDADASDSDVLSEVDALMKIIKNMQDVTDGVKTFLPINSGNLKELYTESSVPVGFDAQRDKEGNLLINAAGEVTMVPLITVPIEQRALNLYKFTRNEGGLSRMLPSEEADYIANLTEEQLDEVRHDDERGEKKKSSSAQRFGEAMYGDTQKDGEDVATGDDEVVTEDNKSATTAVPTLQELAEDATVTMFADEDGRQTGQSLLSGIPKIQFNPERLVQGKPTYRDIAKKIKADPLANPGYVARNISGKVTGRDVSIARRLTNSYEKFLNRVGYSLADAEKVSKWYAANQKDIIAAVGTNQELYDLFVQQGSAGLYKRFNP